MTEAELQHAVREITARRDHARYIYNRTDSVNTRTHEAVRINELNFVLDLLRSPATNITTNRRA